MRAPNRPSRICWFMGVLAALWLWSGGPAKAGDGGSDLASLQTFIDEVCSAFTMSSCPQIPTITQAVLQVAAFVDIAPEAVRSSPSFAIPVGPYVDAGNPSHPPGLQCLGTGCVDPLNPINGLPIDPSVLSSLRPLAFASASKGKGSASPVRLDDVSADTFLYAGGGLSAANAGSSQPDTLVLFYDDPTRTNKTFPPGQVIARVSLPLTVLNQDGVTERAVSAILNFKAPATGGAPCSASTVLGDLAGIGAAQSVSPAAIGVNCAIAFAASPASQQPHAIFEVTLPILVTSNTDPVITSGSPLGFGAPFFGDFGFKPAAGVLGASGQFVGIGPNAAPYTATQLTCDPTNGCSYPKIPSATSANYSLCANLPTNGNGSALVPSVAAFHTIAGDGEVLLSAPLAPAIPHVCPAM